MPRMQPMSPMPGYGGYGGPPQYGAQGGGAPPGPGYEFNEVENMTISSVAKFARMWGVISLISGILVLIMGVVVTIMAGAVAAASVASNSSGNPLANSAVLGALGVALIPTSLVSIIGGIFYMKSGGALRSVVDTQGNDINLLTEAVRSLGVAFKIEAIAMAISFVLGLVLGVVMRAGGHS